jgi:sugar lactone lactonase YvrE
MTSFLFSPLARQRLFAGLLACLFSALPVSAQAPWVTFAGQAGGSGSNNGLGTAARFNRPVAIAKDPSGALYVADSANHVIRKITPAGLVTTFAGSPGQPGTANGLGSVARFNNPTGLVADAQGNLYLADTNNHTIRKITPTGQVTTVAGIARQSGYADGAANQAQFSEPSAVAVAADGTLYVADTSNNLIRKIDPAQIVSTLAGSPGIPGTSDGQGFEASFAQPSGLALNADGTRLYVADTLNHSIRSITLDGTVSTLAGDPGVSGSTDGSGNLAKFDTPTGIAVAADGTLIVTDTGNHTLRRISAGGAVTTLSGSAGTADSVDGATPNEHRYRSPSGVVIDAAGVLFIADTLNHSIRRLSPTDALDTFAGSPEFTGSTDGIGSAARFRHPNAVAVATDGTVYVADSENHTIRRISSTGVVTTLAGSPGISGSSDGRGSAARFNFPYGVAVDSGGFIYVADTFNQTIRKISADGQVSTLAGRVGTTGSTNGTGSAARFNSPNSLAVDASGTVYVADSGNFAIRKITAAGAVSTLAGDPELPGSEDGSGSSAQFSDPYGIAVSAAGVVYVADSGNHTIRKITSAGAVTTLAGTAGALGSSDGTGSAARFNFPGAVAVAGNGTVFVADTLNHTIRRISATGVVTTIGGQAGQIGGSDGVGPAALFSSPWGIAVSLSDDLFVADYDNNRISKFTAIPEIAVEQPVLTNLVSGSASIDFGVVPLNTTGIVRTFTIRSVGSGSLVKLTVTKEGPANSQFNVVSSNVPGILQPDSSTTFTVSFAPTVKSTAQQTASLRIASNDADENPFIINLSGLAGFPEIAVEEPVGSDLVDGTASVAFGAVTIGGVSSKTFTLRNYGTSPSPASP